MQNDLKHILIEIQQLQKVASDLSQQISDSLNNHAKDKGILVFSSPKFMMELHDIQSGIHNLMSRIDFLEIDFKDLTELIEFKEATAWSDVEREYAMRVATTDFPKDLDKIGLREWQHSLLRNYGQFSSLATLLALPSDKEVVEYFKEFGAELDMLSANNCLVVGIGKGGTTQQPLNFDENGWRLTINEQVFEGFSLRVADLFGIKYSEFPCFVVFKDIRSPEYVLVSLKGFSKEGISQRLRAVFSTLNDATANKQDPLNALERNKTNEKLNKIGEIAGTELPKFISDVFATIIGAAIKR